jgi:hypothetical protein
MGTLKGRELNPDLKSRQCSHMDKIFIETSKDNSTLCTITRMTLLSIIIDWGNSAVKMVDISRMSVLDCQMFDRLVSQN